MALGFRFENGIGVTEDCSASVLYYELPARQTIDYIERTYGMDSIEKNKLNLMGPYSIDKNMQV
jgi:ABC-type Na+ transport system ATPase subunit NatA